MNILTFDIEEWYTYGTGSGTIAIKSSSRLEGYLDQLLNLLEHKKYLATFFVLGAIARSHPHILKKIANAGHQIGCHSDIHQWLTNFNRADFFKDTNKAIFSIEEIIGKKVVCYRAPAFSITEKNKWAFEVLHQFGIEYDCSIFPADRDFGGFPDILQDAPCIIEYNGIRIKELPIGVSKVLGKRIAYSGGGYFRLLPYFKIKKMILARDYNMTYFHLRDFDIEQSRKLNLRYFKNYYGINGSWNKFLKLLNDFEFVNIEAATKRIEWDNVPVVKI